MPTKYLTPENTVNVQAVRDDENVVTRGTPGVDAWSLYGEIDVYRDADDGDVEATLRFMLAGDNLFWQSKEASKRAAGWKHAKVTTSDAASARISALLNEIGGETAVLRGAPIVVQLVATDVETITRGEAPQGRYTAKEAYAKRYGEGV